jgi:hypothetical protein
MPAPLAGSASLPVTSTNSTPFLKLVLELRGTQILLSWGQVADVINSVNAVVGVPWDYCSQEASAHNSAAQRDLRCGGAVMWWKGRSCSH